MPRGCRDGEFPDAELGMELVTSSRAAQDMMDMALDLPARLPRTWAALGAGLIDDYRARLIWKPTQHLTDADAAHADEILAALAPGLRYDQLARKATAVAMKLDPEAFKRGKDEARRDRQRVVAGREESGNAFLSGRELAIEDALASKAHIDALAVALRRGGLPGTLQRLRVLAFNDLTQGRHPLDRLTSPRPTDPAGHAGRDGSGSPAAGQDSPGDAPQTHDAPPGDAGTGGDGRPGGRDSTDAGDGDDDASWDGCPDMTQWQHERRGTREDDDHHDDPGAPPGPPAPFPALINLTVPAGTAYGWSTAPGEAGSWGLTDPDDTRRLLQAASLHPRTRWRVTLLAPDGTAAAHGSARGPHPWIPPPDSGQRNRDGPDTRQAAALTEFLRALNRHLHPDRQRQLRPRQPRRPLHPQPQTQRPDPRPHRDLHRPRLRRPGRVLRPRPHPPLPRRHHLPVRPRTRLPPPPPMQASTRLAAHPAPTRRHALDHTLRTQPHHQAHRLRNVTRNVRQWTHLPRP